VANSRRSNQVTETADFAVFVWHESSASRLVEGVGIVVADLELA